MRFLLVSFVLIFSFDVALACTCGPKRPVLAAYQKSDAVLIARLTAVKMAEKGKTVEYADQAAPLSTFVVEKVYKGNVKVLDELTVAIGICSVWFDPKQVGDRFLLYAMKSDRVPEVWFAPLCGRSRGLEHAAEDLLYLDHERELRGKTRLSGTYGTWGELKFVDVTNRTVRIVGEKKTYQTQTDANGVFEIYDLPPGEYSIEPEFPKGWRFARRLVQFQSNVSDDRISTHSVKVKLEAKQHTRIDLLFEPDTAIEGRVVGPQGNPMFDVCLYLMAVETHDRQVQTVYSDAQGRFRFDSILPGTYVIALNPDGIITSQQPFPRLFYGNVAEREKATKIEVGQGEFVKDINFVVTKVAEKVTITGVLRYSDGKPVSGEYVEFKSLDKDVADSDSTDTDSLGRFTLRILKGVKVEIYASFQADVGEYQNCPELDALIKATGQETAEIKSSSITIDTNHDLDDLVLKFPFPRCHRK